MKAIYARNGALCVVNGALVAGTDSGEPGCACGAEPPQPCDDQRPCCDRDGACTFVGGLPPSMSAQISMSGRFILRRQMTRNLHFYTQENTIQVNFSGGAPVNMPASVAECPVYSGSDHRRVDDEQDIPTHALTCAGGQLNITGRPTRTLDSSLTYSPAATLMGYGNNGSGYVARYSFDLYASVGDQVTPGIHLKIDMFARRFTRQEPASVDIVVAAYRPSNDGGPEHLYGFVPASAATADNPCGTSISFVIQKPFDELPGQTPPNGCPILGGTASNQCRTCDSFDCVILGTLVLSPSADPCDCDPLSPVPCLCNHSPANYIPTCVGGKFGPLFMVFSHNYQSHQETLYSNGTSSSLDENIVYSSNIALYKNGPNAQSCECAWLFSGYGGTALRVTTVTDTDGRQTVYRTPFQILASYSGHTPGCGDSVRPPSPIMLPSPFGPKDFVGLCPEDHPIEGLVILNGAVKGYDYTISRQSTTDNGSSITNASWSDTHRCRVYGFAKCAEGGPSGPPPPPSGAAYAPCCERQLPSY